MDIQSFINSHSDTLLTIAIAIGVIILIEWIAVPFKLNEINKNLALMIDQNAARVKLQTRMLQILKEYDKEPSNSHQAS